MKDDCDDDDENNIKIVLYTWNYISHFGQIKKNIG